MSSHADDAALRRAAGLHAHALIQHNAGHPLAALRTLRRALKIVDGRPAAAATADGAYLAAAIWISLALNESEVNGPGPGLVALDEARRRAATVGSPALQVRVHCNHAQMATRQGRLDVALAELDAATSMIDAADDPDHFGILLNSGNLRLFRGDLEDARRLLGAAAEFARSHDMLVGQFMAQHNLGYANFLAGNLPQALDAMNAAADLPTGVSQGIALLDRARVLVESGLAREADETLARAATIFAGDRLAQDLGEVEVARAECALQLGEVDAARRFAARARDRFRRRGNDRWRQMADLVLLQGDLAAGRPGARLAPIALRLAGELRAVGLDARATSADLVAAEALLAAGRVAEARVLGSDAAAAVGPAASITLRLHSRYVRARLELASGQPAAAQRHARQGLDELAAYQASFGDIDLRTASAVHGRRLANLDLEVAVAQGRPDVVLAAIERGRAVSSRLASVRPPADEPSARLLAELRQVTESIRAEQSDDGRLQTTRRELERAIKARAWARAGPGIVQRPLSPAAIRAAAEQADAIVVSYFRLDGRLLAVATGLGATRFYELGSAVEVEDLVRRARADLDVLAFDRLPAPIRAVAMGSLRRSLERLDATLLAPLPVEGRRLVIVPTGVLGVLPWPLLPSRRGIAVVVSPSATVWARGRSAVMPARARPLVVLAGPDLARAEDEATGIGRARAGAGVLLGAAASRAALADAMTSASVVHVAAHGQHQTGNPLFSSLRLADGPLFAHELEQTAPHVVLSACELGLATVRAGEEALGLTNVLLHLGTTSVISGVARINDDAAAEAMIDYHRLLGAGHDTAAALAEAVARCGPSQPPLPFVCFGSEWVIAQSR
jgi:tetratricopeptide (TPR) repeat protein